MEQAGASNGASYIKFIKSQKGKSVLLHAGHRYNFVKKNECGSTNWRCYNKKECSTSITLNDKNAIIREAKHSCAPDFQRNTTDAILEQCKDEVCKNLEPIQKVFENYIYKLKEGSNSLAIDDDDLPLFSTKRDTLYRSRRKYLKVTECKDMKKLKLPHCLVDIFFIYDDGVDERIIIFGTPLAKQQITKYEVFYGDGTFKVTPTPFYQLYTLHVDITSNEEETVSFVPLLYILLPNKSESTYRRFFLILRDQFKVNITVYKCDFELAAINAVKYIYPQATIKGCYYHFVKNVWKTSKKIGLTKVEQGVKIITLCTQLPLLPPVLIPEAYLAICDMCPDKPEFHEFQKYFNNQWILKITKDILSCFKEKFRTTNGVEGWHRRINTKIPAKPSLFLFLQLLKKEAYFQDLKLTGNSKPQKRSYITTLKDKKIDQVITSLFNNKISAIECLISLAKVTKTN